MKRIHIEMMNEALASNKKEDSPIKLWIAKQTEIGLESFSKSAGKKIGYSMGLTKGIEMAEGFSEWASMWYTWCGKDRWDGDDDETFTTSQLLEKYIQQLDK